MRDSVVVFNGDVLTQLDLAAVIALHRERKAKATIVLTPVDNPTAYGLVETDADGNVTRFLEKPNADEITCDTINAGIYVLEPDTFDRIPKDTPWSIERSFFPSLIEREGDVRRLRLPRLLDRHRHAGEVHAGAPRHHGPALHRPPRDAVRGRGRAPRGSRPTRGSRRARSSKARASSTKARSSRPARTSGPTASSAASATSRSTRSLDNAIVWAEQPHQPGSGRPALDPRPPLPHRPQRARRGRRRPRRQVRRHRLQPAMTPEPRDLQGLRRPRRLSRARSTRMPRARSARRSSPT